MLLYVTGFWSNQCQTLYLALSHHMSDNRGWCLKVIYSRRTWTSGTTGPSRLGQDWAAELGGGSQCRISAPGSTVIGVKECRWAVQVFGLHEVRCADIKTSARPVCPAGTQFERQSKQNEALQHSFSLKLDFVVQALWCEDTSHTSFLPRWDGCRSCSTDSSFPHKSLQHNAQGDTKQPSSH